MGLRFCKEKKKSEALPAQAKYSSARSQALKKEERKVEKSNSVWKGEGSMQDRHLMEGQLGKGAPGEEKCEAYLGNRNMQNSSEKHNKISGPASMGSANVKDSIFSTINEKEAESIKDPAKAKTENEISMSNLSSAANDPNRKLEDIEILRTKTAEILSRPNNQELEMDFRATCTAYQANSTLYDPSVMQAYRDYLNAYQKKTSLYILFTDSRFRRTELHTFNTETETYEAKILQTPNSLDAGTCITQLPNGKLFCYGNENLWGVTLLIDVNGEVEVLPSGKSCRNSSCIYFNNSVYCFGGEYNHILNLSKRFDLDQNRWIQLTPMPKADVYCNLIIFNGNILISPWENRNLWLYSIDIESFSTIPYEFGENTGKILINAERLYLIESYGSIFKEKKIMIYESDIGSYTNWRQISELKKQICGLRQVYCSYNKGGIYISCFVFEYGDDYVYLYKFDLNNKSISKIH